MQKFYYVFKNNFENMAEQNFKALNTLHCAKDETLGPPPSDGQIWVGSLRGSDLAVANLYRLYANKLFNYGRQFTRNENLI